MRTLIFPLLLAAALTFAPVAQAQDAQATPLPDWEQLTPAQRDLLIAPIRDRWNREPGHRQQYLDYAKRWKDMPQPQRDRARKGMERWEQMSPAQREEARALFHATRAMDKNTRHAFMEKWRQMSPQQRADWIKAHPAPPAPGRP